MSLMKRILLVLKAAPLPVRTSDIEKIVQDGREKNMLSMIWIQLRSLERCNLVQRVSRSPRGTTWKYVGESTNVL
jgi:hypothetical protein